MQRVHRAEKRARLLGSLWGRQCKSRGLVGLGCVSPVPRLYSTCVSEFASERERYPSAFVGNNWQYSVRNTLGTLSICCGKTNPYTNILLDWISFFFFFSLCDCEYI